MPLWPSTVRTVLIAATAALSACTSPPADYVAADDETLCRYAAGEPGSRAFRQCHNRLTGQHRRAMASNATQIDTPQPNVVALVRPTDTPPTGVAVCRGIAPNNCPDSPNDITGSVPTTPKTPQP